MATAGLCCSIEMEPRTLCEGQLNQARETAGGIATKFERREAELIFTEGLKPIHSGKEIDLHMNNQSETGIASEKAPILENPCQCALAPDRSEKSTIQDQAMMLLPQPHTAPF